MRTSHPTFIVGIGGSAGALDAYKALLDTLPSKTGKAFVIISHVNPAANSQLAHILSSHTKMPVLVASSAMPIQANHVYVIPPDADLLIEGQTFKVVSPSCCKSWLALEMAVAVASGNLEETIHVPTREGSTPLRRSLQGAL